MIAVGVVKNCPIRPICSQNVLEEVFEAVRGVSRRVRRVSEPQHEQRRVLLLGRHAGRAYSGIFAELKVRASERVIRRT